MLSNFVHRPALVLGFGDQLLVLFRFSVFLGHNLELVAFLLLHVCISHIGSADTVVKHSAFLILFVTNTLLIFRLELIDSVVLDWHADIASDLVFMHLRLNFILHKFALNDGKLLLMLMTFDILDRTLSISLDCHLHLEFVAHLVTLSLHQTLFFLVGCHPLVNIVLDLVVPFGRGHTNNFTMVCSNNLLVWVHRIEVLGFGFRAGDRALGADKTLRIACMRSGWGLTFAH